MALGGMEQMIIAMLGKMGIDPEMIMNVADNVQATTVEMRDGQKLILAKLDRIEVLCDRILGEVTPAPAGGFQLGDGSEQDLAFRQNMADAIRPLPSAETLEYADRSNEATGMVQHESKISEV